MQLETAVCTTDSSVEKCLRPADGLFASDLGNKARTYLELRAQVRCSCVLGETVCGGRGKKVRTLAGAFEPIFTMTETRAACCSGVACSLPALTRQGSGSWNPSPPRRRWAGSAGRSRSTTGSPVRTRGGPAVQSASVDATWFECWWPLARGNPASCGSSRGPAARSGPAEGSKTGTACTDKKAHARGDGRRKFLPVTHRTSSFAPRHARGHPFVDAGSSGERWQHRFGMNGQEEADPSDGERLPTRSKPS
jgi:hypothetical protein